MNPILKIKSLTLFIKKQMICKNFNLELFPGKMIGFLAPNGFGKTILLHTLAGLLFDYDGEIFIDQKNLRNDSLKNLAKKRALLFQQTKIHFPCTVLEYCQTGRFPHAKNKIQDNHMVHEMLEKLNLLHKAQQNIQTLSGGEMQRLAIATVLAQDTPLILLDEPLNHLDLRHQITVLDYFKSLCLDKNKTILMTLHNPFFLCRYCDCVFIPVTNGNFLYGTPNEILTPKNLSHLYEIPLDICDEFFKLN